MLRIALCDNEQKDLDHLYNIVKEYFQSQPEMQAELFCFKDGEAVLAAAKERGFQIYFLDILMPGMDGIELGRKLRELGERGIIVYTTVSRDFAFQAYGVSAFQYLEKPMKKDDVAKILFDIQHYMRKYRNSQMSIRSKEGITGVCIDDILYVENVSRAAVYHLKDGRQIVGVCNRSSFEASVKPLDEHPDFLHPHKSFFVNMRYVRTLGTETLVLDDGHEIAVSRRKSAQTKKAYLKYLADGGEIL